MIEKEKWLREMSLKGWSLQEARLGIYTFEKIEPADYIYKLDHPGPFLIWTRLFDLQDLWLGAGDTSVWLAVTSRNGRE